MAELARTDAKAYARDRLRGTISAICLPERDGVVDLDALRGDVRHCLDVIDARGLYVHGYYGHFWLLTSDERRQVIEAVVDEADGAVPIICRCHHASLKETIALVHHAEAAGADMISLLGPQLGQAGEDMVVRWFELVAAETSLGLTVFNTAQNGYVMSPGCLARVAEIDNVAALKNHVAPEHTAEVRRLVGDGIVVIDPEEETFLTSILDHGQRAIYTGTNYMFDGPAGTPMRDYVEAALTGEADEARRRFAAMQPLRDLHHEHVVVPWRERGLCPIATVKWWSELRGMSGGPAPAPLPQLTDREKDAFAEALERATRQSLEAVAA